MFVSSEEARTIIGWDLGGVHVKAACMEAGRVSAVAQVPCALWRGPVALDEALAALPAWAREPARHAVTMTGELCDCFPDRRTGVAALVGWARERLSGPIAIYGGRAGFLAPDQAELAAFDIASANWHATASFAGRMLGEGLLVDIGSTTADLIPIAGGRPIAAGYSDAERLASGELVYTGAVRTPVMALAARVPFGGQFVALMAEHFATMADVHRLLGDLPAEADQQESADGRGKSLAETRVRLARMVGEDAADKPEAVWRDLAAHLAELQLRRLHDAAAQVLSQAELAQDAPVIACGVGRFIVERLATRLGRPCRDLADLVPATAEARQWTSACGPAMAVAALLADVSAG